MAKCLEAATDGQGDDETRKVGFILVAEALWDLRILRKAMTSRG